MKRLTVKHAIRYCNYCKNKLDSSLRHGVINWDYLVEALGYVYLYSSRASEIVGAGKLLDILWIIENGHKESARTGLPADNLPPGTDDLIQLHARQKVEMIEFWNPEKKKYEGL